MLILKLSLITFKSSICFIYIKLWHPAAGVGPSQSPGRCPVPRERLPRCPHPAQLLGWGLGQPWLQGPAPLPGEVPMVPAPRELPAPTVPCHVQDMRNKKQLSAMDPCPASSSQPQASVMFEEGWLKAAFPNQQSHPEKCDRAGGWGKALQL